MEFSHARRERRASLHHQRQRHCTRASDWSMDAYSHCTSASVDNGQFAAATHTLSQQSSGVSWLRQSVAIVACCAQKRLFPLLPRLIGPP
eukprot:8869385-Pyramimonas_sp.AAC.1